MWEMHGTSLDTYKERWLVQLPQLLQPAEGPHGEVWEVSVWSVASGLGHTGGHTQHSTAQRRGWRATERCCNQWPWLLYTHCLEQVRPPAWAGLGWLGWAGWAGLVRGNLAADLPRPGPGCWLQECCPPAPGCCRPAQPSPAQPWPHSARNLQFCSSPHWSCHGPRVPASWSRHVFLLTLPPPGAGIHVSPLCASIMSPTCPGWSVI